MIPQLIAQSQALNQAQCSKAVYLLLYAHTQTTLTLAKSLLSQIVKQVVQERLTLDMASSMAKS